MKKIIFAVILLMSAAACAPEVGTAPDNTLTRKEKKDGWVLLFDGKTTGGWRSARGTGFPAEGWHVSDGELVVEKAEGVEAGNGGDIVTDRKYSNFILSVDFKITPGANSGIKYFVNPEVNNPEVGSSIGCEFQILDDTLHPDAKLGVNGNRKLGSLYDLIPAPESKPYRPGEWNTAVVVVNGSKVQHILNGTVIVEYERNTQEWNALVAYSKYRNWKDFGNFESGYILLQDHGDEVHYKNIKIKEL